MPNLQVLDAYHRVVLADRGRGLAQVVAPDVADVSVNALDFGFCLPPVVTELDLAAHRPLVSAHSSLVFPEAIERLQVAAIAECGEAGNAHVDAHGRGRPGHRLPHLSGRLDRHVPLAT